MKAWLKPIAKRKRTIVMALYLAEKWEESLAGSYYKVKGPEYHKAVRRCKTFAKLRRQILSQ